MVNCFKSKHKSIMSLAYSRDPNKRTGGNRRTGKKLDQELINVQEVINVQGKITSNLFFSLIGNEMTNTHLSKNFMTKKQNVKQRRQINNQ